MYQDVLVSIIWAVCSLVFAGVGVIKSSPSTKPDSGVTATAVVFLITDDTDSCFGLASVAALPNVEPFFITVGLQRGLRANETLLRVPTQRGGTVFAVSD